MTEKKWLSLCMVTRNDEKYLNDCFTEIKQIVDEIIVVDIGSTDQTIDLAKQAGANVYQIEWNNDYSEAKNFCLDHAKGRWSLFLQPNERISTEQLKEIVRLLDNPNAEGYLLYLDQSPDHYRITSPVQSLRLFRNRKEYRYQYKSFEYIPEEFMSNVKDTNIRIHQYADSNSNDIHSLDLQLEYLDEHPENSYLQYMYGIELLNQSRNEEAILYFQSARRNVNLDYLYATHLYKCLAWAYISLERHTDALVVLDEGIEYFPFYTDLLVIRGELRNRQHQYEEAIQDLENSLKIKEQPHLKVPGTEINPSIILENLGEIHELLLNDHRAFDCYLQSFEFNKSNHKLLYKIGEMASKVDATGVLEHLLKAAIEQNDLEQMVILVDVLYQHHQYSQVLDHLEYLKPYLEKKQEESIKFSCQMMLDELKKANQGETCCLSLEQQDYEEVYNHMENLLWLNQTDEAKLYLPLLLNEEKSDDQLIKLALLWAERSELSAIQEIFQYVKDREKQIQFKQKIIKELLHREQIDAAQELAKAGDALPLGALEYVLWSKGFTKKLENWKRKMEQEKTEEISYAEMGSFIFQICKSCTLARLSEGNQKYPYSEIIILEKQRVNKLYF